VKNFRFLKIILVVGIILVLGRNHVWASTLRVHPTEGTYHTVQDALDNANSNDEILVAPGIYEATETIVSNKVIIRSEQGPDITMLVSTAGDGIRFESSASGATLSGFTIQGTGGSGVLIESACQNIVIKNNIIVGSTDHGVLLYIASTDTSGILSITIENNTIVANGMNGIYFYNDAITRDVAPMSDSTVRNNIIYKNIVTGITAHRLAHYGVQNNPMSNNTFYNNLINGNGDDIAVFTNITKVNGNILPTPEFVNRNTGNYRLQSTSPCINAGVTSPIFNDPDGSRNDIGAYGGPGSASFWSSLDVPVITSFAVTPSSVSQGETITLKATGIIR